MRSDTGQSMRSSYQAREASPDRVRGRTGGAHSSFDQVVAKAGAELAHLSGILRQLGCAAQ